MDKRKAGLEGGRNNLVITTPGLDANKINGQYAYVFRISDIGPAGE